MDEGLIELITRHESLEILGISDPQGRFDAMLVLLRKKMEIVCQRDHPLDYIVLALPEDLYRECRGVDYKSARGESIHRDLRRAFKAVAMNFHKPTQILLETTTGLTPTTRKLDHKSVIAWNLFTGLYCKVDGLPWGPTQLPPASCYVGVSFYKPLGAGPSTLRTSVVQAFDENGEGLVLRGHSFHWHEEKQGKSPHLSQELSKELIQMVLQRYEAERRQLPQRVMVHKSSRFDPEERAGFERALSEVKTYDLVSLCPTSDVRLIRAGRYPPLRGTCFTVGDVAHLYTSGYIPSLGGYPHGHVPSPLRIADHVGDTSQTQLLQEILVLTKMNWNSANMAGLMPITLRFSRLVGDILREVPPDQVPQPKYKYYM
jgi:hypothetical protein